MPTDTGLVNRIAARHGITGEPRLLPNSGMVNEAWMLGGTHVLRIIFKDVCDDEAEREAAVVPVVREAGIRTPALVAANLAGDIVPRPYTIYERAEGALLGHLDVDPGTCGALYHELGREIALLTRVEVPSPVMRLLRNEPAFHAEEQLARAHALGKVTDAERDDIGAYIARLDSMLQPPARSALIHRDLHPWNLFADPESLELTAIIDWGDAAWGDPAAEFASMPMTAIEPMLAGYRSAGGEIDPGFMPRTLALGLALSLWELREGTSDYDRRWWRMPVGGWPELRTLLDGWLG